MPGLTREGALQEAREELRRYLSDEIAPMMAAEPVAELVRADSAALYQTIQTWVEAQIRRPGQRLGSADYVFHALRKLLELKELSLMPEGPLLGCIEEASQHFLARLPHEQAHLLRTYLRELGADDAGLGSKLEVLHRPVTVTGAQRVYDSQSTGAPAPGASTAGTGSTTGTFRVQPEAAEPGGGEAAAPDVGRSLHRLGALMARLEARLASMPAAAEGQGLPAAQPDTATHALSSAAVGARSADELEALLDRLESMGVDTRLEQIFRSLGEQVPGWTLRSESGEPEGLIPPSRSLEAMRRLIELAEDEAEVSRRFHQLVVAAVERVEDGALASAARMFDLAEQVAVERDLPGEGVSQVCAAAGQRLNLARLVELGTDPEQHPFLRRVLGFFPNLGVRALLTRLYEEESREVRYHLLALIRVYGASARGALCDQLESCCAGDQTDPHGYFRRNLVFLLRRIPADPEADRGREFSLLARCARADLPLIVVKETIGALCATRDDAAEHALVQLLRDLETALLASNRTGHADEDLFDLLDRVCAGLAQRTSVASARHVANHALRPEPELGDALRRVASLGGRDLSNDPDLVRALIGHLQATLPKKVLGVFVARESPTILPLVKALSGTRDEGTRAILGQIAERYAGRDFGDVAARALRGTAVAPEASPPEEARSASPVANSLDGDLGLFGLPNLLQSLNGSRVTGTLLLLDEQEAEVARIELAEGLLMRCHAGALSGELALFQLLERPKPGRFRFLSDPSAAEGESHFEAPIDPLPLVLEGLRRHDELQQALALVPDGTRCAGTGERPTLPEGTADRETARGIWHLVRAGRTPEECEERLTLDAYSVRSLIAHWVEGGALQPEESAD